MELRNRQLRIRLRIGVGQYRHHQLSRSPELSKHSATSIRYFEADRNGTEWQDYWIVHGYLCFKPKFEYQHLHRSQDSDFPAKLMAVELASGCRASETLPTRNSICGM